LQKAKVEGIKFLILDSFLSATHYDFAGLRQMGAWS